MGEWSSSGFARHIIVLDRAGTAPRYPGFQYRRVPRLRAFDSRVQRMMLEEVCRTERADVFISTYYTYPSRCRTLLYVHDMIPEVLGWNLDEAHWREKRNAIRHASSYVCVSQNTASDLRRLYPQDLEKPLAVVTHGVDRAFYPENAREIRRIAQVLGLPRHYFVIVGPREAYKNAELVFRAAAKLERTSDLALLCVGGAPVLEPELRELSTALTTRVARLSDPDLRAAYSGASALLYVSKYEGFGLPILEAMACGCPVVTCDNSSQREVAGDAALYVDDGDPDALAEAMHQVLENGCRERLITLGRERSAQFDWSHTAAAAERAVQILRRAGDRCPAA